MADDSSTGIVAVLAIFVMVVVGGFFAVRSGLIGGHETKSVEIKVNTPAAAPKNP